ncbi:penicillin-binding protein 1C [Phaeocystidibacter luteus]|uniref:peptidoglycan glycosyltransferase n=1 Tax=Phaeocystidibacter luteus TaxID=911197 RepID=A0A6N6RJZ4_9FLAO|nr:penicillin-binding protein 1C [Phaeocystidibacter luteus]KAB2814191.1 penicillin-binding protein 1C [Phaeocystidibacter luteus]
MGRGRERIKKGWGRFYRAARPYIFGGGILLTIWWYFSIPKTLFDTPYATVTESVEGKLLGARIAFDGQWRFPPPDSIPEKFAKCIIAFEDENFRYHPGVDPFALVRAIYQNASSGKVISGASTISMQVIRLSRGNPSRTYWEKITEMLRATRLEAEYSKDEILSMYASHAPFGGNVVGLDAASWRYYHRPAYMLTWAESAALAVLPNDPSEIRPDRNRDAYLAKRNRLLWRLVELEHIDSTTCHLSLREPLPDVPYALPDHAHHLTERQRRERPGTRVKTAIVYDWQVSVQEIVDRQARAWRQNKVDNAAALVMDVETGQVVCYVGNTTSDESESHEVDMLVHPRSTGSILKPLLYSEAMQLGLITPYALLADIPTRIGDFTPKNFDNRFRGAVKVSTALQTSMNIPAVRMLREVGVPYFKERLYSMGMTDLVYSADHYGLSLILGGAEVRPVQIAESYRRWMHYFYQNRTESNVWNEEIASEFNFQADPESVYKTLQMMEGVARPAAWRRFGEAQGRRIAWKTGTSYGFRDAWAVGTDGKWIVVAWTGNATSEGRPGVIGVETSAPMFFRIMSELPAGEFPEEPLDEIKEVWICSESGYKAQANCANQVKTYTGSMGVKPCPYCENIYLNELGLRVNPACSNSYIDTSWMILPPGMAWYAVHSGQDYTPIPNWAPECNVVQEETLEWIYPESSGEVVRRTRDFDGDVGAVILEAGHRTPGTTIYWSVDGVYLAETSSEHRIKAELTPGSHELTITDENGNTATVKVTVLD